MKTTLLIISLVILNIMAFSQDRIITQKNDTITCKIKDIAETSIKYSYPNEELTNTLNKSQISSIIFASGRIQKISDKIIIKDENDWEKVILTNNVEDVKGLVRKEEVHGKSTGAWGVASNAQKVYKKAEEKLKREAAKLGAFIVLSKDLVVKDGDMMTGQWAKSMLNGIAYGY